MVCTSFHNWQGFAGRFLPSLTRGRYLCSIPTGGIWVEYVINGDLREVCGLSGNEETWTAFHKKNDGIPPVSRLDGGNQGSGDCFEHKRAPLIFTKLKESSDDVF